MEGRGEGGKGEKVGVFEKWEHKGGHRNLSSHFHLTAIYSCSVGRCLFKGALEEHGGTKPSLKEACKQYSPGQGKENSSGLKNHGCSCFFFFFFFFFPPSFSELKF